MKESTKNFYRDYLNLYKNDNDNTMRIKKNVKDYLHECIKLDDAFYFDEENKYNSMDKKFNYILKRFNSEYCHENNLKRYNYCRVTIMAEWLQGLAIHVDFYYNDIIPKFCEIIELDDGLKLLGKKKNLRCGWDEVFKKIAKEEKLDNDFLNLDIGLVNE